MAKVEELRRRQVGTRLQLLRADPDLGRRLSSARRAAAARSELTAPVLDLAPGSWSPRELLTDDAWGALVLDGALLRDVVLMGTACSELIGPCDVFAPLDLDVEERMVPSDVMWSALAPTQLVVLDAELAHQLAAWPELLTELFDRKAARSFRLSVQMGICQLPRVEMRLLLMLWHLAERWGRVTGDDVVMSLELPHRLLGQLVGARRPTVTLALARLDDAGLVRRQHDGTWVLHGHQPSEFTAGRRSARWPLA